MAGVSVAPSITKPVRSYYSTNDTVTPQARQEAFRDANPDMVELVSLGAIGHSTFGFPDSQAADWVMEHIR